MHNYIFLFYCFLTISAAEAMYPVIRRQDDQCIEYETDIHNFISYAVPENKKNCAKNGGCRLIVIAKKDTSSKKYSVRYYRKNEDGTLTYGMGYPIGREKEGYKKLREQYGEQYGQPQDDKKD